MKFPPGTTLSTSTERYRELMQLFLNLASNVKCNERFLSSMPPRYAMQNNNKHLKINSLSFLTTLSVSVTETEIRSIVRLLPLALLVGALVLA